MSAGRMERDKDRAELATWKQGLGRRQRCRLGMCVRERGGDFCALPCHLRLQRALRTRLQPSNIQTNTLPAPGPATSMYTAEVGAPTRQFDCDTYGSGYKHAHQQERGNSSRGHSRSASVMGTWLSIEPGQR